MAEQRKKDTTTEDDLGAAKLQAAVDEAEQQGYFGSTPDDTPNRNYTVAGVVEGAETPETRKPQG